MDEIIAKWIIEFLLHKKIDDKIINGVISTLPLVDDDTRLKKMILLRSIESEVFNGCVSEKLLELIEIIEALNHERGEITSDLMKEAFCMVAVDCTVRFLEEEVEENGRYLEAVERVWRNRVCKTEGLGSEVATRWLEDLEKAVVDEGVCEKILMKNTRNEALRAVRRWLKAELEVMGPSFLEVVAAKAGSEVEELRSGGGGGGEGEACNPCRKLVVCEAGKQKGQALLKRKHVAVKSKRQKGATISVDDEEVMCDAGDNATAVGMQEETAKVNVVEETVRSSLFEPPAMENSVPGDLLMAQPLSFRSPAGDNIAIGGKQIGLHISVTPEVERVQKALKDSTRELHASVTDPLPEALQVAQSLSVAANYVKPAAKNQTELEESMISEAVKAQEAQGFAQNTGKNHRNDAVASNQAGQKEMHVPSELNNKDTENVENQDNPRDRSTEEPRRQDNGRKRSLMEPNDTSHTFEWEDSIENSIGSPVRPKLRSPSARRASPLKPFEDRAFKKRRERKRWTVLEEDTLRAGVHQHGKGNWKLIKEIYRDIFQNRSDVDLKDKWRNMDKFPS